MAAAAPARKKPAPKAGGHKTQGTRSARNAQALKRARTTHHATRTVPARRKSGPVARPKAVPRPKAAPRPKTAQPRTVARPLARAAQSGGSVLLDSLLRGRAWVLLVGVLLAGIVFLNVSVLELNRGIARTDAAASKLERKNSQLRERVATLDSSERVQELAEARGFVLPAPGDVEYLDPNRHKDARLAARRIETPDETVAAIPAAPVADPVAEPVVEAPAPEPVAATPDPAATTPAPAATVAPVTP